MHINNLLLSSIGFICISIQAFVISGLVLTFSSAPESFLSVVLAPNNSITASTPLIRPRCQISDHGRILFILHLWVAMLDATPSTHISILLIRSIRRVYSSLDRATPPYYTPAHHSYPYHLLRKTDCRSTSCCK